MRFFKPNKDIPGHYDAVETEPVTTTDLTESPCFRFSRIIRKNNVRQRGWLTYASTHRIKIFGRALSDETAIAEELQSIMVDDTMTILHYSPLGYIMSVIVGIKPDVYEKLSPHYRQYYYD